jgi:REP element-mobilizing transposase RayT
MNPIYTADNTNAAFQLNWSVALFGKTDLPDPKAWITELKVATEGDGVRILEHHQPSANVVHFLVSTTPVLCPSEIVRSVKGRLQYLVRDRLPKAFRRNYYIGSVGEANCDVLDQYIARQTSKHPMADPEIQERLERFQFHNPAVDLGAKRTGNYGQFVHSLQIVLRTADGWHEVRESVLAGKQKMILNAANKKNWLVSRIGILSDHMHLLLGVGNTESPQSVAISLLNNLAFVQEMKPVFRYSYYAGTFGGYDRGAIRVNLN